jgi:hypothetical protein
VIALSAQRHIRIPPHALLAAFARIVSDEPATQVGTVMTATKRSPIAS